MDWIPFLPGREKLYFNHLMEVLLSLGLHKDQGVKWQVYWHSIPLSLRNVRVPNFQDVCPPLLLPPFPLLHYPLPFQRYSAGRMTLIIDKAYQQICLFLQKGFFLHIPSLLIIPSATSIFLLLEPKLAPFSWMWGIICYSTRFFSHYPCYTLMGWEHPKQAHLLFTDKRFISSGEHSCFFLTLVE